jgi:biotin carboxyl carrier protein
MKYFVTLDGRDFEVELSEKQGTLTASTGGVRCAVDVRAIEPEEKYSVLLDRRSFSVAVDGDGRKLSLVISGRAFAVEVEDERERAARAIGGAEGARGGVIESVMPGVVRHVAVRPGDTIAAGAPLLVLEAMKMQNEIRAESAGVVAAVHVNAGQTVERGQRLVTLE